MAMDNSVASIMDKLTSPSTGRAQLDLQPLIQNFMQQAKPKPSAATGYDPSVGGDVMTQLEAGFRDAGRADLAGIVRTPAFQTWIKKESGWNPAVVSPANNRGRPNGGLFQFWQGHPWAQQYFQGGQFNASPYQQAMLAAKWFGKLSPQRINNYAAQIQAGRYRGWG